MKVLVFSQGFGAITLTFIYNEVIRIAEHHEVTVICNERGDAEPVPFPNVIEIPWTPNKFRSRIQWLLWKNDLLFSEKNGAFKKRIDTVIRDIRPDIIHCHFGNESMRFIDNFTHDIPVVVSFHGYDATQFESKKSYRSKLRTIFSRKNFYPISCSKYLRSRVERLGVNVRKGFLLFYGVDLSRFKRTENPSKENGIRFIQVSSYSNTKGHVITVDAIRKFVDRNPGIKAEFVFGGAGDTELEKIKALVREKNLDHLVHFTGPLTPDEVCAWLNKSHVFLHHSITGPNGETEGLPNAIIEAMAMELPVLSTWHAGIPEIVEDGKNGYLVNERDVDSYVKRMEDIMSWDFMPSNRERITELCDMKLHTERLLNIYKKVTEPT